MLRKYEWNMQDIRDTMKRPNLTIGVEEGAEIQTKGIGNLLNRITAENFPKLKKESHPGAGSLQSTKPLGPKEKHTRHIILKTLSTQNKERILKAAKEKRQITYRGKAIRITADFSTQTINTKRHGKT
jgi:hypothetical protein